MEKIIQRCWGVIGRKRSNVRKVVGKNYYAVFSSKEEAALECLRGERVERVHMVITIKDVPHKKYPVT
jgi:hypothetical protein